MMDAYKRNLVIAVALVCVLEGLVPTKTNALPPEQTTFGLEPSHAVPEPDSPDYIHCTEVLSESTSPFNHVQRHTRAVSISGKTVVLEAGNANHLYDNYNDADDIGRMDIYAETLIIRDLLHLPQTNVTIMTRELKCEGGGQICTTPRTAPMPANELEDGAKGLKAGSIAVHVDQVYDDGAMNKRFILRGGAGQEGGPGRNGASPTYPVLVIGPYSIYGNWSLKNCGYGCLVYACTYDGTTGDYLSGTLLGEQGDSRLRSSDFWPDGEDALPPGRSGDGGDGGGFATNNPALETKFDISGGWSGPLAERAIGGAPGTPAASIKLYVRRMPDGQGWWYTASSTYRESRKGRDAEPSVGMPGYAGTLAIDTNRLPWPNPYALRSILAHCKDTYLYGHLDVAESILVDYAGVIDAFRTSLAWNDVSEDWQLEFTQMRDEIQTLLHRIASNLDYFGNPAGWVPMLSFESNLMKFENEIERAIRVLYLSYWVRNAADSIQERVNTLMELRFELADEIEDKKLQYEQVYAKIPALEVLAIEISSRIDSVQYQLEELEKQLEMRAQKIVDDRRREQKRNEWKKICKVAGAFCRSFPMGQPMVGGIGKGLDLIASIEHNTPWSTITQILDIGSDLSKFRDSAKNWNEVKDQLKWEDTRAITAENIFDYAGKVGKAFEDTGKEVQKAMEAIRGTQIDDTDVATELARIKATDPVFNAVTKEISDLLQRKIEYGRQLAEVMQDVSTISNDIMQNLLAIDGMNREVIHGRAVLDHRALVYLDEMDRRARERLFEYHYQLAKAFEYRLLRPYPGDLNLGRLYEKFRAIVEAGSEAQLQADDFDALKAVYEEELSTIAADIFRLYNENRPELSVPIRVRLSNQQLERLNAGEHVRLNLEESGVFQAAEENIRLINLEVEDFQVRRAGGDSVPYAYVDLFAQHRGVTKLRASGQAYQFVHYTKNTESPIVWGARYDAVAQVTDPIAPSPASDSLILTLLQKAGIDPQNVLIYARPGASSDLALWRDVHVPSGTQLIIEGVTLKVTYSFVRRSPGIKNLRIMTSNADMMPLFTLDSTDLNGRKDGLGSFVRAYSKGEEISVTAPTSYENWFFIGWEAADGSAVVTGEATPQLQVVLDDDETVIAKYASSVCDLNGDHIRSIVGDVPAFVNVVYFGNYSWYEEQFPGRDPTLCGDCNGDGILSIVGDVPCFVNCIYFDNCPP